MGLWLIRAIFAMVFVAATYFLQPFELSATGALVFGALVSTAVVLLEMKVRDSSLKALAGAVLGSILGLLAASLISQIINYMTLLSPKTETFLQLLILASMTYIGMVVGMTKGELLNLNLGGIFKEGEAKKSAKLLDTSVIIDGRVADIAETGFLEGDLILPEFVLRELQMIADSADSVKRNRGRRGLDILQRIQKRPNLRVQIVATDYPHVKGVDLKLIELAKETGAKIVTNDFNLNKVAQLRGVQVLNINELANALKPVVLPGETMKVFILKEGKEYNQGVAYLDDGTMVVVDNAKRMIGKNVEIEVTSVLQTTAGKMIFGKCVPPGDNQQKASDNQKSDLERVSRL